MSDADVNHTPNTMLRGPTVYRIVWLPGTDRLRGFCWCGSDHVSEDPIELWTWLLDHPATHDAPPAALNVAPRAPLREDVNA